MLARSLSSTRLWRSLVGVDAAYTDGFGISYYFQNANGEEKRSPKE